jgi:hypothetical protein
MLAEAPRRLQPRPRARAAGAAGDVIHNPGQWRTCGAFTRVREREPRKLRRPGVLARWQGCRQQGWQGANSAPSLAWQGGKVAKRQARCLPNALVPGPRSAWCSGERSPCVRLGVRLRNRLVALLFARSPPEASSRPSVPSRRDRRSASALRASAPRRPRPPNLSQASVYPLPGSRPTLTVRSLVKVTASVKLSVGLAVQYGLTGWVGSAPHPLRGPSVLVWKR